jgi:epoxyqueuosine reductase
MFVMSVEHDILPGGHGDLAGLAARIKAWGRELGFDAVGISDTGLAEAESGLAAWLAAGFHGQMDYMEKHGTKRSRPAELLPGTCRVISARMSYLPDAAAAEAVLDQPGKAYISRYALGRDYHKVLRARLQRLADRITAEAPNAHRVFVDSAPVMEVALAGKAGLGWRGKHSLLLSREAGSFFFLGEIYIDLPLPVDGSVEGHCGTCSACISACPTGAIVAPYKVDARRCISYLTIELHGSIPEALRSLIGNRIYGCDDCQLVCPWNRFARPTTEADFVPRHGLDSATLVELFGWDEKQFAERLAGSPIYRIGHERWLRNIAVAMGNSTATPGLIAALKARQDDSSAIVREHVTWALLRHGVPGALGTV